MQYNHFTECKQTYIGDSDIYNVKNPPLLLARTIEQQQRRLIGCGTLNDLCMCMLIQEVLSNDGSVEDFNNAALNVHDFNIDMQLDFLRRPLLHLLIIDIYNKRGRCATELRAQYPNVYGVQLTRLKHMLELGADVNLGGTVKNYSALQIAVYLNLDDVVSVIARHSIRKPEWQCTTQDPYQSSLIKLLVSGYYHRDPENTMASDGNTIASFVFCLFLVARQFATDPYTGQRKDPLDYRDTYNKCVMSYLREASGLSRDFPRDRNLGERDKVYILRDLFVELHDFRMDNIKETPRYKAFMSSSLHAKNWNMPMSLELREKIFTQSLGLKLQERIKTRALYQLQSEAQAKNREECTNAFMACTLHSKNWRMPVPDELRDKIIMHTHEARDSDPLRAARNKALALYKHLLI